MKIDVYWRESAAAKAMKVVYLQARQLVAGQQPIYIQGGGRCEFFRGGDDTEACPVNICYTLKIFGGKNHAWVKSLIGVKAPSLE